MAKTKSPSEEKKVNVLVQQGIEQQFFKTPKLKERINVGTPELLKELKDNVALPAPRTWNLKTMPARIAHMVKSGGGVTAADLERVIGIDDTLPINYLQFGLNASKAVCRILVVDPETSESWAGTGFLVSPTLLLTNNHVIKKELHALNAIAEFDFEADLNGLPKRTTRFRLAPGRGFITSDETELDFTVVAIEQVSEDGKPLSDYGFLRLDPDPNKVNTLEYVTIIQHPNGDEKRIAIRENKVIKLGDALDALKDTRLWYASDTAPGSSGASVFNDSWQVVAIHHSAVPLRPEDNGHYRANEGIRISSLLKESVRLYNALSSEERSAYSAIQEFLDDASGVRPFRNAPSGRSIITPESGSAVTSVGIERSRSSRKNIHPIDYYNGREGYDDGFLGMSIPLPKLTAKALEFGDPSTIEGSSEIELKYTHFSVVHNATRKLAFFTASNIDGTKWRNLKRDGDKWWFDSRIPLEAQIDDILYANEPMNGNKGWFDRGHLVRRLDPVWGTKTEANQADMDTFHWVNCTPQYWGFNQGQELWQGLENYLLYNTDKEDIKACIFTGPIFGKNDEEHRGILIPQYFWKLIVLTDSDEKLYSSAYRVSQKKYATDIPFEVLPVEDFNNFQITVTKLESLTGLQFAQVIRDSDVAKNMERDIVLRSLADVKMPRLK